MKSNYCPKQEYRIKSIKRLIGINEFSVVTTMTAYNSIKCLKGAEKVERIKVLAKQIGVECHVLESIAKYMNFETKKLVLRRKTWNC